MNKIIFCRSNKVIEALEKRGGKNVCLHEDQLFYIDKIIRTVFEGNVLYDMLLEYGEEITI